MSQTHEVDLIGRVLQAIASTPHRGADEARYQAVVVEPARALRRRWEEQRGAPVDAGEARHLIEGLLAAFEVKRVEPTEQRERLREILAGTALEAEISQWTSRIPSEYLQ